MPPILRPVQLTLVPDHVDSYNDVANALRHCVQVCTLLDNQKDLIKNTYCLRVALVQHLFTHVLPLPLPHLHPRKDSQCFWGINQDIRYETQVDILRLLEMLCRHFSAASLSLKVTRSFDCARIVTLACLATVADAVVRKVAVDIPSQLSLHLSARAKGPTQCFGIEMGHFLEESGFLSFVDPHLAAARTHVLDYFSQQQTQVPETHKLFRFEASLGFGQGEERLLRQLCLQVGFPYAPHLLPRYLSGDDPLLLDNYPELGLYRDICFLFKAMMAPTSESLPELRRWKATDARLTWRFVEEKELAGVFHISGFNQANLRCAAFTTGFDPYKRHQEATVQPEDKGLLSTFLGFFRSGPETPRAPPSGANPSNLVGEPITTEDDVLHIKTLPDFGGRLKARDCELLLQYLTVPYMRIPLILQFFADQSRIQALNSFELQEIVDACCFEPSLFQASLVPEAPEMVPTFKRELLSTPAGLLFNELQMSPKVVVKAIEDMLFFCLELDTGKYSADQSNLILYIVRLVVRVLEYITFALESYEFQQMPGDSACNSGAKSFVRGLEASSLDALSYLKLAKQRLHEKLEHIVYPVLNQWCDAAIKNKDMQLACVLYAHMSYVFLGFRKHELTKASVTTLLIAYVFISVNFRFTVEVEEKDSSRRSDDMDAKNLLRLGISQTELFSLFQVHRKNILTWSHNNAQQWDEVMEALVKAVTLTTEEEDKPQVAATNRHWLSMTRPHCAGRFMPDTEVASLQAALRKLDQIDDFEEWLRQSTTLAVDTEVNIQLGEFTLKKNPMQLLPDVFLRYPDFIHVLGKYDPAQGDAIQCAQVNNTTNRTWLRLVGRRHDVQLWNPDSRSGMTNVYTRAFGSDLHAGEQWIASVLDPYIHDHLAGVDLFLPKTNFASQHFARLTGLLPVVEEGDQGKCVVASRVFGYFFYLFVW